MTIWGVRLTLNFARKGGYSTGGEDYRWEYLKKAMHPIVFQIFNVLFIAFYQNFLLLAIALPSYEMYINRENGLRLLDILLIFTLFGFLIGEIIADEQQWVFQSIKYELINKGRLDEQLEFKRGFVTEGLFSYSRHPNFFCEIMIWWNLYFFTIASGSNILNWSIVGAVLLNLLFLGSTPFTEMISSGKYPEYKVYQSKVSRLVPWFPRGDVKLD